nr:hypothetical protein CFP56_23648 [Quercus suber]
MFEPWVCSCVKTRLGEFCRPCGPTWLESGFTLVLAATYLSLICRVVTYKSEQGPRESASSQLSSTLIFLHHQNNEKWSNILLLPFSTSF